MTDSQSPLFGALATFAAQTLDALNEHGWGQILVFGDDGTHPFGYTYGLTGHHPDRPGNGAWPELVVIGLPPNLQSAVFAAYVDRLTDHAFDPWLVALRGTDVDLGFSVPFRLRGPVNAGPGSAHPGSVAHRVLDGTSQTPAFLQLMWPAADGSWPTGDDDADRAAGFAPLMPLVEVAP